MTIITRTCVLFFHQSSCYYREDDGRTPLSHACSSADASMVKLLLSKGADATIGGRGWTPLMYAARRQENGGAIDIVNCLLRVPAVRDR